MNGMTGKKHRRQHDREFTTDGVPRDPNAWTEDDWRDLNDCYQTVVRKVAERHGQTKEAASK